MRESTPADSIKLPSITDGRNSEMDLANIKDATDWFEVLQTSKRTQTAIMTLAPGDEKPSALLLVLGPLGRHGVLGEFEGALPVPLALDPAVQLRHELVIQGYVHTHVLKIAHRGSLLIGPRWRRRPGWGRVRR